MSQGEYAIAPALHGDDTINYFPSFTEFGATLKFNNTDFINAFSQIFVSFAANLDPNAKLRPSITPVWPMWSHGAETEMVFNKTELDEPYIALDITPASLLRRCEYVLRLLALIEAHSSHRFWGSMRYLVGQ
jgi:hypothetical protein